MSIERTLCMVKPDAVGKRAAGAILATIEESGLRVVAVKSLRLSRAQADRKRRSQIATRSRSFGPVRVAMAASASACQWCSNAWTRALPAWRSAVS